MTYDLMIADWSTFMKLAENQLKTLVLTFFKVQKFDGGPKLDDLKMGKPIYEWVKKEDKKG